MFQVNHLCGFGAATASASSIDLSATASSVSTADQTTYTFSGLSLGTADAAREIVVATSSRGSSNEVPSSVTVGGISATQIFSTGGAGDLSHIGIYRASVPTGTTGDVVVTFPGSQVRCAVQVWRMLGAAAGTHATASDETVSSGVLTTSIAVPAGGAVVAMIYAGVATGCTWTNLTENSDGDFESERYSAASAMSASAQTLTVTATVDVGAARGFLGVASFAAA